jgi:hypothetical protein
VLTAAFRAFLPAVENRRQNFLEPLRLKQTIGDMRGGDIPTVSRRGARERTAYVYPATPFSFPASR